MIIFWRMFLAAILLLSGLGYAQVDELDELWPIDTLQTFDFEDQPLGPIGTGGANLGQPSELSNIYMLATVVTGVDGQRLEIERDQPDIARGAGYVHFNLIDDGGISGGRSEIRARLTPSALDQYQIIFAGPSGPGEFGVIRLESDGSIRARGSVPDEEIGTYEANESLNFVAEHWLDDETKYWNLWLNGEQVVEERAFFGALDPGLGRVSVGYWSSTDGDSNGTTMWLDLLEVRHGLTDLTVLLDADFDNQTLGEPIGTGGAANGEPVAIPAAVSTELVLGGTEPLREGSPPDLALELTRELAGSDDGTLEWRFLHDAEVEEGFVLVDLEVMTLNAAGFLVSLEADDGEELLDVLGVYGSSGGKIYGRFPDDFVFGTEIGSYNIGDRFRIRVACLMDERLCSIAVDDDWAIHKRAFADSTSDGFVVSVLQAGLGFGSAGTRIELDNIEVLAARASLLPSRLEFEQQPVTGSCGEPLAPALEVAVRDGRGVLAPSPVTVELSEDTTLLEPGTLIAPATVSVAGIATFPTVTVSQRVEGLRLAATSDDPYNPLITVSEPFDIGPGAPDTSNFMVVPDAGVVGRTLTPPVQLLLEDECDGPVAAGNEVFLVVQSGPPGGSVEDNGAMTNAAGEAVFTGMSFTRTGEYTLRASVYGELMGSTSLPIVISDPPPGSAVFLVQPGETPVNLVIDPAVTVRVLDDAGVAVVDDLAVSLVIEEGPADASVSGASATTVSGNASFPDLSLDRPGMYRFRAQVDGMAAGAEPVSDSFEIVPGAPVSIEFVQQPDTGPIHDPLNPAVQVQVVDVDGFEVIDGTSVEISLAEAPAGASLSGTLTRTTSDGLAAFSDLMVDQAGAYRLRAETDNGTFEIGIEFLLFDDGIFQDGFED